MTDRPTPSHLFQKGHKPPPRTGGSRPRLAKAFFNDVYAVWEEQGEAVLRRAAFEKPMEFAAMVAKLMPQKLEITTPTAGMTDERFEQLLDLAETQLRLSAERGAIGVSASMTIEGSAVDVTGGGGSPHDCDTRGEVVDPVHYSPDYPTPSSGLDPVSGGPDFGAAPLGDPLVADMPNDEDEIDPVDLY